MKKHYCSLLFLSLFIFLSKEVFSATYYSRVSGSWNTPSTWSIVGCSGSAATTVPTAADNVIICVGKTVTMNGSPGACLSLTVHGSARWTSASTTNVGIGGLILNNGADLDGTGSSIGVLNVAGGVTVPAGVGGTIGGITISVTGMMNISGTLTFNSFKGIKTFTNVNINSGGVFNNTSTETYNIMGNLTMTGASIDGSSTGVFNVAGSFNVGAGISTFDIGTINVTGATNITGNLVWGGKKGNKTFGDLVLASGAGWDNSVNENFIINGNLQNNGTFISGSGSYSMTGEGRIISGTGVINMNTLICSGTPINNGILTISNVISGTGSFSQGPTGILTYSGGGNTIQTFNASAVGNTVNYAMAGNFSIPIPSDGSYSNLTVSGGFTKTLTAATLANKSVLISAGTILACNNFNLTLGGDFVNNGTFTPGANTVTLNGTAMQEMSGTTATAFTNLTISNTVAAVNASTNFSTSGVLNVGSRSVLVPAASVIVSGAGTLTGAGTVGVTRIGASPDFISQYTITSKILTNLIVDYRGAGNQNVNVLNYYSLLITGNGTRTVTFPFGTVRVSNVFSPSLVNTTYLVSGNTIEFNGTLSQTIPVFNFHSLSSTSTGARTLSSTGIIGVASLFTPGTNAYTISGSTINFNGTIPQTITLFNYFNLMSSSTGARTLPAGVVGVAGSFTPGTNTYTTTGNTINFNGTSAQVIPAFKYNNLTSSAVGSRTLASTGIIEIASVFTPGTNAYTVTGSTINFTGTAVQDIPAFNYFNLTSSSTGTRNLSSSGIIGVSSSFTPGTNVYTITGSTLNFNGTAAQTIPAFNYENLTSSSTGSRVLASSGIIGVSGVFTPGVNTYVNTGSTIDFNGTAVQTIPAFNYNNLTISSTGARVLASTGIIRVAAAFTPGTNSYTVTGSTIDFNGGIPQTIPAFNYYNLTCSSTGSRTLTSGAIIGIAGTFTPGINSYTVTGSTIDFNGTAAQAVPAFTYYNLTSSSSGARTLASSGIINIAGNFSPGANVYNVTGSTVSFSGPAAQFIPAFVFYNLITNGSGTKTLNGAIVVTNDLSILNNLDVSASNYSIEVKNNFINNGTFNARNGRVSFNGLVSQALTGQTSFYDMSLNNGSGVNLNANVDINHTLDLVAGSITTSSNVVSIGMGGNVIRNNGFVNGYLKKYVFAASDTSSSFEVGSAADYTPVFLKFGVVTSPGYITVKAVPTDHPAIATSGLDITRTVNRYWDVVNNGVTFDNYSVRLEYAAADREAGVDPLYAGMMLYTGSSWQYLRDNINTLNSVSVSNVTALGSLQIGLIAPTPDLYALVPAVGYVGQTLDVSFIGGGFITGMSFINSLTGVTINSLTILSDTLLKANITISPSAAIGSRLYKVNNVLPGGGDSDSLLFTIKPKPVANFIVDSYNFKIRCKTDGVVKFSNTSVNGISYLWDFGSGAVPATANGAGPYNVSYSTSGYKTIRLIAINPAGNDTLTKINYLNVTSLAPPQPSSISGPVYVCPYGTSNVLYTAPATDGATSYNWTVASGINIVSGQGTRYLMVSFSSAFASGNINVQASNACGNSAIRSLAVTRKPVPRVIIGPKVVCGLTSATYSIGVVTGATSYNWTVPLGVSIVSGQGTTAITVNFSSFTAGNIAVAAINACGTSAYRVLAVSIYPPTPVRISGPVMVCGLASATYTISAVTGATSYNWVVPAGMTITSGQGTRTLVVSIVNTYTTGVLSVTAVNACGSSAPRSLSISTAPPASLAISGNTQVCGLTSTTYSVTAVAGATSYNWAVPAGMTIASGQGTISISVNIDNTFSSGSVSVASVNSCGTSAPKTLAVKTILTAPSSITGITMVCGVATATYSTAAVAGAASYNWTVPTGVSIVSGQGTTSVSVSIGGGFTTGNISVAAVNSCGTSTYRALNLYSIPKNPASISGSTNVCGTASATFTTAAITGATSYNWSVPSGVTIVSGQGTTSLNVNIDPTFVTGNLSVAAANSCGTSSARTLALSGCREAMSYTFADTIANEPVEFGFNIYPNPSDGNTFNVKLTAEKDQEILVVVFDITGKSCYSKIIITEQQGDSVFAVDPSSQLAPGIYIITATSKQEIQSKRLIVN